MQRLLPYLQLIRLKQPTGIFLLLWPCWWGIVLAGSESPKLLILFAIGAVVMRSAGCIVNDIVDRNLDKHVERTKKRPLASGAITLKQALVLLFILLAVALKIALAMNPLVLELAIVSLFFVATYPFMKRITWWPQAFLGLTFNWGALMGWAAVKGSIGLPAIFLYVGGLFWTLGYDTIYAYQDKADDLIAGIKSSAIRLGQYSKVWLAGFYCLACINWWLAGSFSGGGYYDLGLIVVAAHFVWQIVYIDTDNPASCLRVFRSNAVLGLLLFICFYPV